MVKKEMVNRFGLGGRLHVRNRQAKRKRISQLCLYSNY